MPPGAYLSFGVADMAGRSTTLAQIGQFLFAQCFAGFGARLTQMFAGVTNDTVLRGMTQHEIVGGMTKLRTIQHDANVRGFRVAPAFFEAVVNSVLQSIVSSFAGVDASIHLRSLMFMNVIHVTFRLGFYCLVDCRKAEYDCCRDLPGAAAAHWRRPATSRRYRP